MFRHAVTQMLDLIQIVFFFHIDLFQETDVSFPSLLSYQC